MTSRSPPAKDTQQEWLVVDWSSDAATQSPDLVRRSSTSGVQETLALFETRDSEGLPQRPPILSSAGFKLCFLPDVATVAGDTRLVQTLTENFRVPSFFWESLGTEANGFFRGHREVMSLGGPPFYSTVSRFLIKSVDQVPNRLVDYHWQYAAFASCWSKAQNGDPVVVLLCFDMYREQSDGKPRGLARNIKHAFEQQQTSGNLSHIASCPLGIYSVLIATLLSEFDAELWGFKSPLRDFEKNRLNATNEDQDLGTRYGKMHELSRHIIHMSETIEVTAQTIEQIVVTHQRWSKREFVSSAPPSMAAVDQTEQGDRSSDEANIEEELLFDLTLFRNLKLRAKSFEKRLHNEIQLAFNWVAAQNSAIQQELLFAQQVSLNAGKSIRRTVEIASMTFLPATFLTGVFGMNMPTFTGDSWSDMSWELGGVLIALLAAIMVGILIIYLFGGDQDERQRKDGKVREEQINYQVAGELATRSSIRRRASKRWNRLAQHFMFS
ncbi:uncharacterized protein K489DRAFT_385310 [Dissoconium aciculare CBS 342.82]|uniref:Mg2+ transporter protein n=1 Tax=Dissoconium aciculare CBS 342.82 TaxID=1314786 RepID=A0A6J3LQ51_9PEZI|nr:uncharacterized protein K489DRAFT_385310 [Dissoconium aciculare CBS 342.82]KAF1818041.1 hypothetical protein K489DRAFT_385310 [Dissoconium aciculare CBS 342.82]